jgi:hypothetical protein
MRITLSAMAQQGNAQSRCSVAKLPKNQKTAESFNLETIKAILHIFDQFAPQSKHETPASQ